MTSNFGRGRKRQQIVGAGGGALDLVPECGFTWFRSFIPT